MFASWLGTSFPQFRSAFAQRPVRDGVTCGRLLLARCNLMELLLLLSLANLTINIVSPLFFYTA